MYKCWKSSLKEQRGKLNGSGASCQPLTSSVDLAQVRKTPHVADSHCKADTRQQVLDLVVPLGSPLHPRIVRFAHRQPAMSSPARGSLPAEVLSLRSVNQWQLSVTLTDFIGFFLGGIQVTGVSCKNIRHEDLMVKRSVFVQNFQRTQNEING